MDCLRYPHKGNYSVDTVIMLAPCKGTRGEERACMCTDCVHVFGLDFNFFYFYPKGFIYTV